MDVAEMVLKFTEALVWPGVIVIAVLVFRNDLRNKLAELTKAETAFGTATFDKRARKLEAKAADVAERQEEMKSEEFEQPPAADSKQSRKEDKGQQEQPAHRLETYRALSSAVAVLNHPPDFGSARTIASTSPEAAVMLAYSELEGAVRSAWIVDRMSTPRRGMSLPTALQDLARNGTTVSEFIPVARELAELRNRVAHGGPAARVSVAGALDFVATCETVSNFLAHISMSRFWHPSRSLVVRDWVAWMEQNSLDGDVPSDKS